MTLIDTGDMEAGHVFRHELAGALTALEVALGQEPSLTGGSLFTRDEDQRSRGTKLENNAMRARSDQVSFGRLTWRRRTESW